MHILYLIFIAPIELVLNSIFTTSYNLVHSYGLSIIILSAVMSIILIPVYNLADSWQNAERLIQEKMKNELDFIKRCFKKQERMVMTNTTHKLHKYHPIMAVRTSVGFLIQVPFFFGAYHLLSNYTALEKIPFLIFKDLSQPDQLLSLGSLHINIMPIVMTIVSLLGASIYTKNLARKDKIQLWVLTLLFLVLLYNSPVGLVIYWTLNNIFAVIKNVIPKDFTIITKYKNKLPSTITDKLLISLVFLTLFFTIISLIGLGINYFAYTHPLKNNESMSVLRPAIALLIFTMIVLYGFFIKDRMKKPIIIGSYMKNNKLTTFIWFISLILLIASLLNLIKTTYIYSGHYSIFIRNSFVIILTVYILNSRYLYKFIAPKLETIFKDNYNSFFYWLLIAFVIYIGCYLPVSLIENDTSYFKISPKELLDIFIPILSLIVIIGICINRLIYNKIFKYSSLFCAICILTLLSFSFINLNLGIMEGTSFTNPQALYKNMNIIFDVIFSCVLITGLIFLISSKFYKYINKLPIVFSILMIVITFYNYQDLKKLFVETPNNQTQNKKILYSNNTLNFSKTHKNIVMLILDGFDGRYIQGMLDDKLPSINELSDFTYYANTFSPSNATYPGYGAIIGGFKYTPEYIEKHHYNIMQGYQDAYKKLLTYYKSNNFETSLVNPAWMTPFLDHPWATHCENNKLVDNCISDLKTKANYSQLLLKTYFADKKKIVKISKQTPDHQFLSLKMAIFKVTPLYFKKYIYYNGHWMVNPTPKPLSDKSKFIASMPYISTTDAKTNTFKVIHTMVSHAPFEMNPNTCLSNIKKITLNTQYTKLLKGWWKDNYGDDVCTIKFVSNFIKWLKNNNIYNNTKIVLVSEHDFSSNPLKEQMYTNIKTIGSSCALSAKKTGECRPYSLLMVKDFNTENKKLVVDIKHFVTSYDVPSILCEGLPNCHKKYGKNFTKIDTTNRQIITSTVAWNSSSNYKDHYKIFNQIQVTDNIFNIKNYKLLTTTLH